MARQMAFQDHCGVSVRCQVVGRDESDNPLIVGFQDGAVRREPQCACKPTIGAGTRWQCHVTTIGLSIMGE